MNLPLVYIGFAQALFTALIFFLKKPLKIADVIIAFWLIAISSLFALNIFQEINQVNEEMWFFSLGISITFPPFLFLYSKYVTADRDKFKRTDLLHALPLILLVHLILIFSNSQAIDSDLNISNSVQLLWLRNYYGFFYLLILIGYGILSLIQVIRYKKQIKNNYSFRSDMISLNWLLVVVVSFIVFQTSIVILSSLYESKVISYNVDFIQNGILLGYVYVMGIWGYRQSQLTSDIKPVKLNQQIENKTEDSGKYLKSGLKNEKGKQYTEELVQFMNRSEAWKDNELSVAKLSVMTGIPKHYITQTLNEYLNKNFYVFVNEYRVEFAKKLLLDSKYDAWSMIAIAYECGFNSKTAFNIFFKKHTGTTPSDFKKEKKN